MQTHIKAFMVIQLITLLGLSSSAWAGEETYYGRNPNASGKLHLIGFQTSTTYTVTDLSTGVATATGTLAAGEQISIPLLAVRNFKMVVSDPMMALLHHDCCAFSGDFFYPPVDGKRFYGSEFRIRRIAGSTVVFATEPSVVQVFDNSGVLLETSPALDVDDFWLPTTVNSTDTFQLVSTGTIAVGNRSQGNGVTQVPPVPPTPSEAPDCNNDTGQDFYLFTASWATGAVGAFNYGSTAANIELVNLSTNAVVTDTIPPQSSYFRASLGTNFFKLSSDQPLSVWAGDTEGGSTLRNMGDDVTTNLGSAGTNFVLDSATQGSFVFAADDGTVLTGVGAPVMLDADEVFEIPAGQGLTFSSSKAVTVQTISGNSLNDWGTMLRPARREDRDNDGTPDRVEGDCDAIAPDSDGDGIPDYRDDEDNDGPLADLDGDGILNGQEVTLGTLPNSADSDGDGLCDGTIAVAGVCVSGEDAAGGQNSDMDLLIDALDPDDDNDGVDTFNEDTNMDGDPTNDVGANGPRYLDPCDPNADAVACPTGDADGDGEPNGTDPNPLDACDPDPNDLLCDTGDTDGDGISNSQEIAIGTLSASADSDGDGLCDGTIAVAGVCVAGEDAAGGQNSDPDILIDALDPDDDGDMKSTLSEDINGDGDPTNDDSDGDSIPDYLDPDDADGPDGDIDGDGLTNSQETALGTLSDNADSDGDGLCDGTIAVMGVCVAGEDAAGGQNSDSDMLIDALDPDDDGDGALTASEDTNMDGDPTNDVGANGPRYLDPCDPNADAVACPTGDADGDGEPNGTDPNPLDACDPDPNDLLCDTGDTDGDGVNNALENARGTALDNADTDGDGLCDGTIAVAGVCVAGEDAANEQNSDMDMIIDALDSDDDGDMKSTLSEDINGDGDPTNDDSDGDSIPDYLDPDDADGPGGDVDGDGISNTQEAMLGTLSSNADTDGDGLCDGTIAVVGVCVAGEDAAGGQNSDGDALIDALDDDDDDDGVNTISEDTNGDGNPANDLGVNGPRYLDPCDPNADVVACPTGDADGDGEPNGTDPEPLDPCNPDPNDPLCNTGDTDGDGIVNSQELVLGTLVDGADSDGDGLCDGVIAVAGVCVAGEDAEGGQNSDTDALIDALDSDDDGDGVPTSLEDVDADGDPTNDNSDNDTVPDYLDTDDDGDGVLTIFEDVDGNGDPTNDNSDEILGDTVPNYLDADDDGDGVDTIDEDADPDGDGDPADAVDTSMNNFADYLDPCTPDLQGQACLSGDTDGDGFSNDPNDDPEPLNPCVPNADALVCPSGDFDMDGISNEDEATLGTSPELDDSDGDGIKDLDEVGGDLSMPVDTDDDEIIDALDPDDDNDGILTRFELGDMAPDDLLDTDEDLVPNYLDADDDGDGVDTLDEGADPDGDGDPADAVNSSDGATPDYLNPDVPVMDFVAISTPSEGADITADFTVSGTGTPGETVIITINGMDAGSVVVDENGDWSFDVMDQPEGMTTVIAEVGDQSDSVTFNVEPAQVVDMVSITSPADGDEVSNDFTITGMAAPGAEVEIIVDGMVVGMTTADENGDWSFDVAGLEEGMRTVEAKVGDATQTITVDVSDSLEDVTVALTSPSTGDEVVGDELEFSGTATPGATIEIFVDGMSVGSTTADENGDWSLSADVESGDRDVYVEATLDDSTQRSDTISFTATDADAQDPFEDLALSGGCQHTPASPSGLEFFGLLAGLAMWRRRKRR